MQPVQSLKCQLFYVLPIHPLPHPHPPLTPRKDNAGETIANCCLDCGIELWLHKTIYFTAGFNWTVLFDTEVSTTATSINDRN